MLIGAIATELMVPSKASIFKQAAVLNKRYEKTNDPSFMHITCVFNDLNIGILQT